MYVYVRITYQLYRINLLYNFYLPVYASALQGVNSNDFVIGNSQSYLIGLKLGFPLNFWKWSEKDN